MPESSSHPFVEYLCRLKQQQNRGALAQLRRGLGKDPGSVPAMYPYVTPWLGDDSKPSKRDAIYLIAALFALHGEHRPCGDFGESFREVWNDAGNSPSIEKRFVHLLNANREELPGRLRHAVSLMRSKNIPVDFSKLLNDLQWWDAPGRFVQQRWAQSFWGKLSENESNSN